MLLKIVSNLTEVEVTVDESGQNLRGSAKKSTKGSYTLTKEWDKILKAEQSEPEVEPTNGVAPEVVDVDPIEALKKEDEGWATVDV
jgi:hypothetical protein